jgi:putative hydrolase of the HAD superfamily
MKNKVVIFDLDDTLFNEIDFLISAYNEISQFLSNVQGVDRSKNEIFDYMHSLYLRKKNPFEQVISFLKIKNIKISDLLEIYRNHLPNISLNDDVKEVLDYLKDHKFIIGIITDGRSIQQRNKIKALSLDYYISGLIISEEFGSEKPNINNYIFFQDKYPNSKYTYIGDNINKDFVAPNKLNWETICLLDNGKNIHSQKLCVPDSYLPNTYIKNIKEIIQIVS